ncbi:unnamed protein product [Polarella glacialis]|uniref:C3H1-type domain-containing protein n=1 Tax=Polarella glacialis TaxID=89957 RepID=A0A813M5E8_POLGL|nr:unnamed protein product [Polarella glacialis]
MMGEQLAYVASDLLVEDLALFMEDFGLDSDEVDQALDWPSLHSDVVAQDVARNLLQELRTTFRFIPTAKDRIECLSARAADVQVLGGETTNNSTNNNDNINNNNNNHIRASPTSAATGSAQVREERKRPRPTSSLHLLDNTNNNNNNNLESAPKKRLKQQTPVQPSSSELLALELRDCLQHLAGILADQFLACVPQRSSKHTGSNLAFKAMYTFVDRFLVDQEMRKAPAGELGQHVAAVMTFFWKQSLTCSLVLRSVFGEELHDYDALRSFLNCSLFDGILSAEPPPGSVKLHPDMTYLVETAIEDNMGVLRAAHSSVVKVARKRAAELLAGRAFDRLLLEDGSAVDLSPCIDGVWARPQYAKVSRKFDFDDSHDPEVGSCRRFAQAGACRFGDSCKFRHDRPENPDLEPPEQDGLCRKFAETGSCRLGDSCKFRHDEPWNSDWEPSVEEGLCRNFGETGSCRFGDSCKFRHARPENPDWEPPEQDGLCRKFAETGSCRFGDSCKFIHDEPGNPDWEPSVEEGLCRNFGETGSCRFGDSCKFRHARPENPDWEPPEQYGL